MKTENEPAPPPTPPTTTPKKPRKDRGTRRVSLPARLVKELEAWAERELSDIPGLLVALLDSRELPEPITLPPSVQARLAPAAAATGRSVSDLLADLEGDLCALLDGRTFCSSVGDEPSRPILSLQDRLVEAFRARLKAATEPIPEPPAQEVVDLMGALKDSLAKGKP